MTLEGSGEDSLRIHRLPHRVVRGGVEGEGSDRSGENEDDKRGGRYGG